MAQQDNSARYNITKPSDGLKVMRKISCDLKDGVPTYDYHFGKVYSHVPGERDRLLFSFDIVGVTTSKTVSDNPDSIYTYRSLHKEVLMYNDPVTNEIIHKWENPWTNKECHVIHIANDPVNFTLPGFMHTEEKPFTFPGRIVGNTLMKSIEVPLLYPNPLGGEFQESVGGKYHATEMFGTFVNADEALDRATSSVKVVSHSWSRICQWLPWMEMGDRAGFLYFHSTGSHIASLDELPPTVKKNMEERYPDYLTPPPLDDDRRNETSWIYYKRIKNGERKYPWSDKI